MKITVFTFLFSGLNFMNIHPDAKSLLYPKSELISISRDLLLAARTGEDTEPFTSALAKTAKTDFKSQLNNDDLRKAFWLNIYNACTQIILSRDTSEYGNRHTFFSRRQIMISGEKISLDDIEHGILRRSKIKWSLGYLNKPFPSLFEKGNRVDTLDYRVHFALNCGAQSCPPIAFYDPQALNRQLNIATRAYLLREAEYDPVKNTLLLPAIMSWFRADFGGRKGMIRLIRSLGIIPDGKSPKISFKKYNWNLYPQNFKNENDEPKPLL